MTRTALSMLTAALLLAGCNTIGPTTIPRDRFDYSGALAESWKNQLLLNLVKVRYLDLPIYLDVGQIVAGYSLETQVGAGGQVARTGAGDTFATIGGQQTFTDRPTITYTPQTGQKFLESFLAPIHPAKVLALVQSGFAADFILELSVDSLNGLRNQPASLYPKHGADADFFRVLTLLREVQDAGAVGLRVDEAGDDEHATVLFFRREGVPTDVLAKIEEARALLGLEKGRFDFRLVRSPLRGRASELALATRSLLQVMSALARGVDVPPAHVERRLTPQLELLAAGRTPLLRVRSGSQQPQDAFVAVPYEGAWFWIAQDDWHSKRTFSSILFLFTLADTGGKESLPVLTIPTH